MRVGAKDEGDVDADVTHEVVVNVNLPDDTLLFALCFCFCLFWVLVTLQTPRTWVPSTKNDGRHGFNLDNKVGAVNTNADQNGC